MRRRYRRKRRRNTKFTDFSLMNALKTSDSLPLSFSLFVCLFFLSVRLSLSQSLSLSEQKKGKSILTKERQQGKGDT